MRALALLLTYYGCAAYSFFNPFFGLLFFLHITLFRPDNLVWGHLAFGRLHLVTSILILIGYFVQGSQVPSRRGSDFQSQNIALFALFLAALFLSSGLAEASFELSYNKIVDLAKIFLICFLFSRLVTTKERLLLYVWVGIVSLAVLAAWGVEQGLRGNPRLDTLTIGGSNYLAAQLVLLAPLALTIACDATFSRFSRLSAAASFGALSLCVVYSNSRGGFLGLLMGILGYVWQSKARVKTLVGIGLCVLLILPWIPESYTGRLGTISAASEEQDLSARVRPVLWQVALRIWRDHPFLGVGLENFFPVKKMYMNQIDDLVRSDEIRNEIAHLGYTHGLYPGMLAETGVMGTGLFLLLLFRNIFCRFPQRNKNAEAEQSLYMQGKAAQAGLLGFAVSACFGDFQYLELLYFQIFFVGAVRRYADSYWATEALPKRATMRWERQEILAPIPVQGNQMQN